MTFLEAVEIYFRGERLAGYLLAGAGVVSIAAGLILWRVHGAPAARGLGIPLLVIGVLAIVGGPLLARTVSARQDRLSASFDEDPTAPVAEELTRMEKVNKMWKPLKLAWAGVAAIAFVLVFAVGREWVHGLALALLIASTTLMVVDSFAERRGEIYETNLRAMADSG